MLHRFLLSVTIYIAVFRLEVTCLQLHAAFVHYYDPLIGGQTLLECKWNTAEHPNALYFFTNTGKDLYFICDFYEYPYMCKKRTGATNRHDYVSFGNGTISMSIDRLQCSDEGTYKCKLYRVYDMVESTSVLRIRVPPTPPMMSNVRVSVGEGEEVTATCTANLGYPRPLAIVWKAFFNEYPVALPPNFRVSANNVTQPGDDHCTVRTQSVARFFAQRSENGIVLACFVTNSDFMPVAPTTCGNHGRDLCMKTNPVHVVVQQNSPFASKCIGRSTSPDDESSGSAVVMMIAVILSVICITQMVIIVTLIKRIKDEEVGSDSADGVVKNIFPEKEIDVENPPEIIENKTDVEPISDNKQDSV